MRKPTIKELEARIAELEIRIAAVEALPRIQHHYHYPAQPLPHYPWISPFSWEQPTTIAVPYTITTSC